MGKRIGHIGFCIHLWFQANTGGVLECTPTDKGGMTELELRPYLVGVTKLGKL